ncbi:MAG: glycosyltransferase [Burkholderiales bacterium]|nr:glycosyltransferase [Burkholderiales bacterium]
MTSGALDILHLSATDNEGGSGRSAYRIHTGLRERGHRSRMLVGRRVTQDPDVDTVAAGRAGRRADLAADIGLRRLGLAYQWLPSQGRSLRHPWVAQAQLYQLYNLHGGYFTMRFLSVIGRRAPLIWRLSDLWPMTGHCVYPGDCVRWMSGCGACPQRSGYVEIGIDTSAWLWRQKARIYRDCDITVVAPSSWTERMARQSPLLGGFPVVRIPNGLETRVFRPVARDQACATLGWPVDVRRIVFVAHGLDANPRKGGAHLMEALRRLGPRAGWELLLAGVGGQSWLHAGLPLPVRLAGYVTDDERMAAVYSAADIVVVPSAVDNLPNTVLEAMACGVPGVAFDVGGMRDAVRHRETGYLARADDVDDLAAGIASLIDDEALRLALGRAALALIRSEFTREVQAQRFEALYREVLAERAR